MPRDAPKPAAFEPAWLQRSLDRHYTWGLVFMVVLILGFILYGLREPSLRANAAHEQQATYARLGAGLFANNCASCHLRRAGPAADCRRRLRHQHAGLEPRLRRPAHRRADPPARRLPPLPAIQRARRPQLATRQTLEQSGCDELPQRSRTMAPSYAPANHLSAVVSVALEVVSGRPHLLDVTDALSVKRGHRA